ncbi:MAG: hypothetical protein HY072_03875, partial [Deltaproteobacteria bacterium]|nr:hypothetical protein [Deltaproteobacteria bacterium]
MHLEQEVNPDNMASAHPLRAIFKNIPQKIVSIKFILDRISDPNRPTSGQEAFVKIQVLATVSSTLNTQISTTSFLGLYPRELNTFALILRGDILLNTDDFSSHAPNSVRFPLFASKAEAGKGIIFLSPVFTNHSLYLPDTKDPTDTRYNNITFGDKLVLAGSIFQNGEIFKPATLGHPSEQYFVQQTRFRGLLRGVDLDRIPDMGGEYLWDPNAVVDDSLMKLCILRTQIKMNLFWTQDAILVVKQPQPALIQGNKKTFNFRVGLSKKDEFKEASAHKIKVTSQSSNSTLITKTSLDAKETKKYPFPILRASIQFGDNNGPNNIVIAHLSPESELDITLREPSEPHLIIKTHAIATNQVGLEIQFTDPTKFPAPPKIKIYAYDFGTDALGNNLRDGKFGPNRVLAENTLTFAGGNQADITGPALTADWSPLPISG